MSEIFEWQLIDKITNFFSLFLSGGDRGLVMNASQDA